MIRQKLLYLLGFFFISTGTALAQMDTVDEFAMPGRRAEPKVVQKSPSPITPQIKDALSSTALKTILEAEQAFCYTVATPDDNYSGYTIDGMALTGFCGILPPIERNIFIDEYLKNESNVSSIVDQCLIRPRILLRFLRGVDYVDVLYSSPCHSFTVFYAGQINSFNTAPSAAIMDALIGAYEKQKTAFVSPALLGQVIPIGVPQNDAQRNLIRDKTSQQPVRNWNKTQQAQQPKAEPQQQPAQVKGWNQIKMNKK